MLEERAIQVDEADKALGTIPLSACRREVFPIHRATSIVVVQPSTDELLLQRRVLRMREFPGCLDLHVGLRDVAGFFGFWRNCKLLCLTYTLHSDRVPRRVSEFVRPRSNTLVL